MKKLLLLIALPVIALVSGCSKDQKVVRQLDGEWKITALSEDGKPADKEDYEGVTYKFEKCKVSKGDCNGSMKTNDPSKGEITFPFTYNISDKGTKIMIKYSFMGMAASTTNGDIIEHSKSKFVYSFEEEEEEEDENGKITIHKHKITTTLEKQ
ncbi:MAG: lipocalin family protein [Bacteroidetes bacterium]|nr:lipocalin family protein [Bacteroidota bacterium]